MKNNGKSEIKIHSIVKETEKAICVNVSVNWGEGNWRTKDVWFPKSTAEVITVNDETHIVVADWMIEKASAANVFNGYRMNFCGCFNSRFAD